MNEVVDAYWLINECIMSDFEVIISYVYLCPHGVCSDDCDDARELHRSTFTHRSFYTHRNFYTEELLHTEAFTRKSNLKLTGKKLKKKLMFIDNC
jgi:hypothetical protein